MGKKLNTVIFIIAGTIIDLILVFAGVTALITVLYLCRNLIPEAALSVILFAAVIGGIIIGMILYQRIAIWVVEKFNLEDKLDPIFRQRPRRKR